MEAHGELAASTPQVSTATYIYLYLRVITLEFIQMGVRVQGNWGSVGKGTCGRSKQCTDEVQMRVKMSRKKMLKWEVGGGSSSDKQDLRETSKSKGYSSSAYVVNCLIIQALSLSECFTNLPNVIYHFVLIEFSHASSRSSPPIAPPNFHNWMPQLNFQMQQPVLERRTGSRSSRRWRRSWRRRNSWRRRSRSRSRRRCRCAASVIPRRHCFMARHEYLMDTFSFFALFAYCPVPS